MTLPERFYRPGCHERCVVARSPLDLRCGYKATKCDALGKNILGAWVNRKQASVPADGHPLRRYIICPYFPLAEHCRVHARKDFRSCWASWQCHGLRPSRRFGFHPDDFRLIWPFSLHLPSRGIGSAQGDTLVPNRVTTPVIMQCLQLIKAIVIPTSPDTNKLLIIIILCKETLRLLTCSW